ncbi:hypothetical protein EDB19DRAFT_1829514 [Suillus lakei]|nr:hypothetical protein EDB19DRAFT_1829514 [Suillus lakei]
MISRGKYVPTLISWLRHIVKTAVFRSYRSLLSVLLRLIRYFQSVVNGKEEDFRKRPSGLTSSSQPATNQPDPAPPVTLSLAVPLLEAPPQSLSKLESQPGTNVQNFHPGLDGGSNDSAFNTDFPPNSSMPWMSSPAPELGISEVGVATSSTLPKDSDITLTPIVPDQVNRYGRNVRVTDEYKVFLVEKGPLACSEELAPVAGWEPLTHPEGALFFYHPYKRVFTDANVRDPVTAAKSGIAVKKAYEEARNANIFLHPSVELALEFMVRDGQEMWGYYFGDHERRVIFWFEDYKSSDLMNNVRGVERKNHVILVRMTSKNPIDPTDIFTKLYLEHNNYLVRIPEHNFDKGHPAAQPTDRELRRVKVDGAGAVPRRHIELFPNRRFLPEDVVVELKELVLLAHAENITSETCLAPFARNEVASILGLVDLLKDSTNKEREHSVWIAAQLMRLFCNAKFVNFCGQSGARLDVDQSLYGEYNTRTGWKGNIFSFMDLILVGSLDTQSKAIHRIWVDEIIVQPRWKDFIDKLATEWNTYAIFIVMQPTTSQSTVMLAVDISLLTVTSVASQTSAIVCTYLSIICIIGSLVVTLFLVGPVNNILQGSVAGMANLFYETNVTFYARPREPCLDAQLAVCISDLGHDARTDLVVALDLGLKFLARGLSMYLSHIMGVDVDDESRTESVDIKWNVGDAHEFGSSGKLVGSIINS